MEDVRAYGATGDGAALDHPAFQRAIDRCVSQGGGMVMVPPGQYRCGTIHLKSRVRLHLEAGAEVHGSKCRDDYPAISTTCVGPTPCTSHALFYADDEDDLAITGYGSVFGGGDSPLAGPEYLRTTFRPAVFLFVGCQRVRIADLTIKDSRHWTVHLLRCSDVRVNGVTISNNRQRISSVGLVADCSRDVLIGNCVIEAGDDAVAVKSTQTDRCENITIANCVLRSSRAPILIAAQSVGVIRNVMCSSCIIDHSHVGIAVLHVDGGSFENLSFVNLAITANGEFPIIVDATARREAATTVPGHIRGLRFSGITVHGRGRAYIQGHPASRIERVTVRDMSWAVTGFCDGPKADKVHGSEHVDAMPGGTDLAAKPWQFVFAHLSGLRMADVSCHLSEPLPHPDRGLLYLHDVHDAAFADLRGLQAPDGLDAVHVHGGGDLHGLTEALRSGWPVISGLETGLARAAVHQH
jgi:hypothetical protein